MNAQPLALGPTVGAARRALAAALRTGGFETPDLDARLIVGHALGLDHTAIVAADRQPLSEADTRTIAALAARRLTHEPVARLRGSKEFWSLAFRVTPDVLVPRPETETVVEAALGAIGRKRNDMLRIADLGTGSGALLVALLSELPHATGVATDISTAALAVARDNARTHGTVSRAHFVACDYGAALGSGLDVIVANPPYIRTADIAELPAEVRGHDPHLALDGGDDGLEAYRVLAADASRLLRSDGIIVVECGIGQADAVTALFLDAGLGVTQPARVDLAGISRAVIANRL
jgi:release factor glutamine methyltransferase